MFPGNSRTASELSGAESQDNADALFFGWSPISFPSFVIDRRVPSKDRCDQVEQRKKVSLNQDSRAASTRPAFAAALKAAQSASF